MKLSSFQNIISIDSFLYVRSINDHEKCLFTVTAHDDEIKNCISQVGKKCVCENGSDFNFTGIVDNISVIRYIEGTRLKISLIGITAEIDEKKYCRVFQNPEKNISDILKSMELKDISFKGDDVVIPQILVQDNETDWRFLLRLSSFAEGHIFPGEKSFIGFLKENASLNEDDISFLDYRASRKGDSFKCRLKDGKKIPFGSIINYNGKSFFVYQYTYSMEHFAYKTTYYLREYSKSDKCSLSSFYLKGKVTDNEDDERLGRVKVEFMPPYNDVMKDNPLWIETNSFYASKEKGAVFLPEIDDEVIISIVDGEGRVLSSIRTESFDKAFQNPNHKYFLLPNDTYLDIGEENIILDNTVIKALLSKEGLEITYKESVKIKIEDNHLYVEADKSKVNLTENIQTETKDFTLKGGNFIVKTDNESAFDGGNTFKIKANSIKIKGMNGVDIN